MLEEFVKPGVTSLEFDKMAEDYYIKKVKMLKDLRVCMVSILQFVHQ